MAGKTEYSALVVEAERAVASVADPVLRRAAFEKILGHLLQARGDASAVKEKVARKGGPEPRARTRVAKGGPRAYVQELVDEGFFKKPKVIGDVRTELGNRGHHIPLTSLSGPLQRLCQSRVLRRQRTKAKGKAQVFSYSNW